MKIKKILETKQGEKYFVKDVDKDFHTKYGIIKADLIKNAKEGDIIFSDHHEECVVYSPQFIDQYSKIKRLPQIVPLKDIGFLIAELGLGKDSIIAEGGSGSGGVCCFLANIVKKVYTFEINDDNFKAVQDNIEELGLKNIELKKQSMYQDLEVKNVDVVFLDVPEPWLAINSAEQALKIGGFIVSYSPHLTSTLDYVNVLKDKNNFSIIKTVEIIEQPLEVRDRKARPKSERMHSGFITIARKLKN
jgi:tRNA (adenine57-N1/adenine58-N1)-methyltransferase catalytic subunit